jgi:PAS domain S-box-containing protein
MDREHEQWKAREVARLLALVETERRYYQEIVASIPVGILILSPDLTVVSSNREVRRIFGLRSGEPVRGTIEQFLPETVVDRIRETIQMGVAHDKLAVPVPGEPERSLRVSMRQIGTWDDEPSQEALVTIEDAPAQSVAAAPAAGLPVPEMIESLDAVIWAAELSSKRFLYVNDHAVQLLGYSADHWVNTSGFWAERIHPTDRRRVVEHYSEALNDSNHAICEFQALTASGEEVWLRESVRLLQDEQGHVRHLIGFAVDVTERHMLDAQFMQAQRVDAVNRLSARLANEINNQAMIVAGYTEDILAALEPRSPLRSDLREIQAAAERLRGLATKMSSAHRTQAAPAEPIDVAELLREMEPGLRQSLGEHGFDLRVFPQVLGVRAEPDQLHQVVRAFIDRACAEARHGQRITIDCSPLQTDERSERAGLRPGVYAVIRIDDNGPTLDDSERASLFDGFGGAGQDHTDTALALARAYRIVRQWGGDISVSNTGPGTRVRIYLPRAGEPTPEPLEIHAEPQKLAEPAPPQAVEAPPPAPPPPPRQPSILVVEGEGGIRTLIQKMLRRQGYQVLDAADAATALKVCEQNTNKIDLLIADASAKPMASAETLEQIRRFCPGIKPLFLVGDLDDHAVQIHLGSASLAKPFTLGSLVNKVKNMLEETGPAQSPEDAGSETNNADSAVTAEAGAS